MGKCNASITMKIKDNNFPVGMRVMAVDDDSVCLRLLEGILLQCGYRVTATQHANTALKLLRDNPDDYDLVISDVQMPDMDGFKLLETIGLEMDIPVIMLSVDSEVRTVKKGIMQGACDFLVKPVRLEELKIIWKHVVRRSKIVAKEANNQSNDQTPLARSEDDSPQKALEKNRECRKEREDEASNCSDDENSTMAKKPRISWSTELHSKFIDAVNKLGVDRAVPKKILDLMNVPGLSRENVASHLQKYRKALKKNGIGVHPQFRLNPPGHIFPPFDTRLLDTTRPFEGFRVHGYQNHRMNPIFGHVQNSLIPSPGSPWFPLPLNHNNNVQQHYGSITQREMLRTMQCGYLPNPSATKFSSPQSEFNKINHQSFAPNLNQQNGYVENLSHDLWANNLEQIMSLAPEGTYDDSIDFLFDSNNSHCGDQQESSSATPDAMIPNSNLGIQINEADTFNMQNYEETDDVELMKHLNEDSATESIFQLSKCDSADDLQTVLKQFQQ